MKNRKNNRGFTLVELIIAVAILAIAILPLFSNFIQSSKMNMQGRKDLNAMNLAQGIMEGMRGYRTEEVSELLDKAISDAASEPLVGTILPTLTTHGDVVKVSGSADSKLEYKLVAVETVGTNHNKYDVEIEFDPTGDDQKAFNGKEYAMIQEINQHYDAVFTMPDTEEESIAYRLKQNSSNQMLDVEDFYGNIARETQITIENKGDETNPQYTIGVRRSYSVIDSMKTTLGHDGQAPILVDNANVSTSDEATMPRSLYFYFEGMRGASYLASEERETIKINNTTGQDITVYLIRTQKVDAITGMPDDSLIGYGQNFGCLVEVESENMTGDRTESVSIVSNLRFDLNAADMKTNVRVKDEDGHDIDDPNIEIDPTASTYLNDRATYIYNGDPVDETLYQEKFHDGYQKEKKNTIYKVVINIYESGTNTKIATYDGGLSN